MKDVHLNTLRLADQYHSIILKGTKTSTIRQGHIDFAELIKTLMMVGYQGFVSAEMIPFPDPDTAAIKTIEYMRKLEIKK